MSDSEERDSDMESSEEEEDSEEESGEEGSEDDSSQPAAASAATPRSLVLDAGARMEMLLHRLRSAHLDALTRVAYGMSLPATPGSRGAAAAPLLPLPALPGSKGPRSVGHADTGFRASLPKHSPAAWARTGQRASAQSADGAGQGGAEPTGRDGGRNGDGASAAGQRRGEDSPRQRGRLPSRRRSQGRRGAHRDSAADVDRRLAAAAQGAELSPRTREAVVAAAIDRLLGDE